MPLAVILALAAVLTLAWGSPGKPAPVWREISYRGHTTFEVRTDSAGRYLHAESRDRHSVLVHPLEAGPLPARLSWRWRALRHPEGADPGVRARDDRAAGVFVLIRRSILPWRTRGLLYQWAPAGVPGRWTSSPYASGIRVLTLETAAAGPAWREEDRDLTADLKAAFGAMPDRVEAIGVLCDSDNTGAGSTADFGEIRVFVAAGD